MNINDAFLYLNLDINNDIYDLKKLKKHYHFLALKYHPDKNQYFESKKKFQEINQAYNILLNYYSNNDESIKNKKTKHNNTNDNSKLSFEELFEDFVNLLNIKNEEEIIIIKKYFLQKYNYYNALILEKLSNNNYFKNLYDIFNNDDYKKVLIINTEIDNVLNSEIYKLNIDDEILFIPLWYKEVIYKDYLIKIKIINLDNKILIDSNNNIFIKVERNYYELLDNDLSFNLGSKNFTIKNNLLYMKKTCNYKLNNCGIINPYCDISEIDETSNYISNIYINLTLI